MQFSILLVETASVVKKSPGDQRTRFRRRQLLLSLAASVFSARTAVADPNIFLNRAEIDAIKAKVDAGAAPWTDAYAQVLASADATLALPLLPVGQGGVLESVTYGGPGIPGSNLYASDRRIPHSFSRYDYFVAIRLKDKVRDLGLAYAFTGEAQYADRAIELINHWSLNPETYGNTPQTDNYSQTPGSITADNSMALSELAYSYYQDPAYLEVLERWGRPINDIRPMGNTTLTHGNTFELDLTALSPDGDFDADGDIDGFDFIEWQRGGLSASDLAAWEANFGTAAPLAASTSVPEPSTGLMMLVCCGVCAIGLPRRS